MTDAELRAEFAALFPHGWAGPDVRAELAPGGWAASPLAAVFHPTARQVYEEAVRVRRNLAALGRRPGAPPPPPEPTLAEVEADHRDPPVEPERECQELVGRCLWDVFCDNHEVVAADGRVLDLGSMRAGGGFLAEVLNAQGGPPPPPRPDDGFFADLMAKSGMPADSPFLADLRKEMLGDGGYTYLDFYMGTVSVAGRADLGPVYALIFRRLRGRGMDWMYTFPRLYAVDLRPLKEALAERSGEPEWAGYDPAAALEEERAERQRDEELAEFRGKPDEGHREAVAAARAAEPPATVRAYAAVYGRLPHGWPPAA
jgi:hypothetical protein